MSGIASQYWELTPCIVTILASSTIVASPAAVSPANSNSLHQHGSMHDSESNKQQWTVHAVMHGP